QAATLIVSAVQPTDTGVYDVLVAGACDSVTSQPAQLVVITFGDLDCDGIVDADDVAPFVLAMIDPERYMASFPACDASAGDFNRDGTLDGQDIARFVSCVLAQNCR